MGQHILVPPEPLLARIQAPTLLLWGERDRMVPVTNAEDYLRVLPNARRVVLPNTGHVPMEESPAEVVRVLREFLAG
jgi:pimeloyl-ACP methyl ester carboxylesterase